MSEHIDHTGTLLDHIRTTYKSRFNAHSRLLRMAAHETISVAVISILVLSIHLIALIGALEASPLQLSLINVYSIVASVLIVALSVYHSQNDSKVKAMKHYRCAIELQLLFDKAKLSIDKNESLAIADDYHGILQRYDLNHHRLDYVLVQIENQDASLLRTLKLFVCQMRRFVTFLAWHYVAILFVAIGAILLLLPNSG